MARGAVQSESEVCAALLETYDVNDCMNQLSLEHLDARAWRASPEGKTSGKDARLPEFSPIGTTSPVLDEKLSSPPEVSCAARPRAWHDQADTRSSPAKRSTMPGDAEGSSIERHLQTCDSILTRKLGAQLACGNTMFRYMFAPEAHHRGQAIVLARQRGYKLPDKATYGI